MHRSRMVLAVVALAATAAPAAAKMPKPPSGSYSGPSGQGAAMGIKVGGRYHLNGAKTGLFVKDFYIQLEFRCTDTTSGEPTALTDSVAFDAMKRYPVVYRKKSNFFEVIIDKATAVHGHLGSAPFGNNNWGMGRIHMVLVFDRNAKGAGARWQAKADGQAPPQGTLLGTETLKDCSTLVLDWTGSRGSFI